MIRNIKLGKGSIMITNRFNHIKGVEDIASPEAFRFYMGRHRIVIANKMGKKAIVKHLEKGYVGSKKVGYKEVDYPMWDIVLIRHCRHKKRDGN